MKEKMSLKETKDIETGSEPIRTCALKREEKPKDELLRFTLTPDNVVIPDFKKKFPGKGIYISNSKAALTDAIKKKKFGKGAKADEKLIELVENLLRNQCLSFINFARKASVLVTGFEKVKDKLKKDKVSFLIQTTNAGADGRAKMKSAAGNVEILTLFTIEELDQALNRVNTVHAALLKSEMADMVYNQLKKWQDFINSSTEKTETNEL